MLGRRREEQICGDRSLLVLLSLRNSNHKKGWEHYRVRLEESSAVVTALLIFLGCFLGLSSFLGLTLGMTIDLELGKDEDISAGYHWYGPFHSPLSGKLC